MATVHERNLLLAMEDVRQGLSESKATARWSMPRNTLRGRLRGAILRVKYEKSLYTLLLD